MTQFTFQGWILIDGADRISNKPCLRKLLGKEILLFRDSKKRLLAFDSRCPHMNADLSKATIQNDNIICPFHAWKFSADGKCVSIPGEARCLKEKSDLKKYRVVEKFDLAFISFQQDEELRSPIDEPEFFQERDFKHYRRSVVHKFEVNTDWHLAAANSFDLSHFVYVHNRRLTAPVIAKPISKSTYMIDLKYQILPGGSRIDSLIRLLKGPDARLIYLVCLGNYIRAEARFGGSSNLMMIVIEPAALGKSIAKLIVYVKKSPFARMKAALQAKLSKFFFTQEVALLNGVRINWDHLTTSDSLLISYYSWLQSSLQQFTHAKNSKFGMKALEEGLTENENRI